ncbi:MAG: glycosyltransferase family 39 protein [Myxococcales bacterium]|nr:glycosyltransferase family 39 protein [Myxococcales bacterium]
MSPAKRHNITGPVWLLLFLLLALPATRVAGSNVMSRFATAVQAIDLGDLDLGPYAKRTNDAAVYDGRVYSDKAPGVTLALMPAYFLVRPLGLPFDAARHLCRLLTLTLFTLLTMRQLNRRLPQLGVEPLMAAATVAAYGVGTVAYPYFFMLYGHGFAANAVTLGVLYLIAYRREPEKLDALALSGFFFGLAILFEYPTALLGLFAGLYLLTFERRLGRVAAFAALGALLPLAVIGAYNLAAFGAPFRFGYDLAKKDAHYTAAMASGFMGIGRPTLGNLLLLTFSPSKGLFFWSPLLLLGAAGLGPTIRRQPREGWLLAAMAAGYLALFAGYFEAGGGACLGPRHVTPIIGPLLLAGALFASGAKPLWRGAYLGLAVLSSLLVWAGAFSDPQMQDRLVNPLWDFAAPMLREGIGPGNLLGLPDRVATGLALALLLAVWAGVLFAVRREEPPARRQLSLAAGGWLAAGLIFYLGVTPLLPRTEPGLVHQILGNHFVLQKNFARAAEEYETAWTTRKDPWILYYQAKAYRHLGDEARATATLEKLAAADPAILPPAETKGEADSPPEPVAGGGQP